MVKAFGAPRHTVFRARVARSVSRVWKLWTGAPSAVRPVALLASAAGSAAPWRRGFRAELRRRPCRRRRRASGRGAPACATRRNRPACTGTRGANAIPEPMVDHPTCRSTVFASKGPFHHGQRFVHLTARRRESLFGRLVRTRRGRSRAPRDLLMLSSKANRVLDRQLEVLAILCLSSARHAIPPPPRRAGCVLRATLLRFCQIALVRDEVLAFARARAPDPLRRHQPLAENRRGDRAMSRCRTATSADIHHHQTLQRARAAP